MLKITTKPAMQRMAAITRDINITATSRVIGPKLLFLIFGRFPVLT